MYSHEGLYGKDHNVNGDAVDGDAVNGDPVVCVGREEVQQVLDEMKTGNARGPSQVSLELIAASGGVRIQVMAEICLGWIWNAS